jgi:HAD superfamily hydrolase (TIGR01509 family)
MKAFLFDIDGVLFESSEVVKQTFLSLFKELGLPLPTPKQISNDLGYYPPRWFEELGIKGTKELDQAIGERFIELYPELAEENEDALPVFDELRSRGCKLGVVTNQIECEAKATLALLGFEFDCVKHAGHGAPKPAPDLILNALSDLEVEKSEALFVGDVEPDVQAALAAGVSYRILARPYNAKLKNRIQSLRELLLLA